MKLLIFLLGVASIWAVPVIEREEIPKLTKMTPRIIGGDEAEEGQFPWQVAVYFDTDNGTFFCGGSLISDQWILTAGHCTYSSKIFTLHLGAKSLVDPDDNRVTVATDKSKTHPDYNPETLENDVGLIKLTKPVDLNEFVQIIDLGEDEVDGDVEVVISGWGQTGEWSGGVTNELNFVNLKTISNEACADTFGSQITADMLCAKGTNDQSPCAGDSGGPLVDTTNNVQVGIATFVSSSGCDKGDPSGYARVAHYVTWIQETIQP